MKKIKILFLFVCLSTFLSACGDDNDTSVPVAVKTVLMYLVGDNNISGQIYNNIESVERGLSEVTSPGTFVIGMVAVEKVNFLFQLCLSMKWMAKVLSVKER